MGSGLCVFYAPATFALDDQNRSVVIDAAGDPAEALEAAVEACPTEAISRLAMLPTRGEPTT